MESQRYSTKCIKNVLHPPAIIQGGIGAAKFTNRSKEFIITPVYVPTEASVEMNDKKSGIPCVIGYGCCSKRIAGT